MVQPYKITSEQLTNNTNLVDQKMQQSSVNDQKIATKVSEPVSETVVQNPYQK